MDMSIDEGLSARLRSHNHWQATSRPLLASFLIGSIDFDAKVCINESLGGLDVSVSKMPCSVEKDGQVR